MYPWCGLQADNQYVTHGLHGFNDPDEAKQNKAEKICFLSKDLKTLSGRAGLLGVLSQSWQVHMLDVHILRICHQKKSCTKE